MTTQASSKKYPVVTSTGEALTMKDALHRLFVSLDKELVRPHPFSPEFRSLDTIRNAELILAEHKLAGLKPSTIGAILSATAHPEYKIVAALKQMKSDAKRGERNLRNTAAAFHFLQASGLPSDSYVSALETLRVMTGYKDAIIMVKNLPEQVPALLKVIKHFSPRTTAADMFNPELRRMLLNEPATVDAVIRFAVDTKAATFSAVDTARLSGSFAARVAA